MDEHRRELSRFFTFAACLLGLFVVPYAHPALASLKPWVAGEPLPIIGLWWQPGEERKVEETADGIAMVIIDAEPEESAVLMPSVFPDRSPAIHAPLDAPPDALTPWFLALSRVEDDLPGEIARTLVWGDSTIASDRVIEDVRSRMQARFGDGGPGFLAVQVDPYWSMRADITRWVKGEWTNATIVSGGAGSRYGLAGVASTAVGETSSALGSHPDAAAPLRRAQVFYQTQPGGGSFSASFRGDGMGAATASGGVSDGYRELHSSGTQRLYIKTTGDGPVTFYGAALETAGPGVTWETFGIAGASIASMKTQRKSHFSRQVAARDPALVVYWTGGNEVAYPSVQKGDGETYRRIYGQVVDMIRAGAPDAACLLIGPLDQATRKRGQIVSKTGVDRLIRFQKMVAAEQGCAYWDARAAMGGEGAFARWLRVKPRLASPDLMHITRPGGQLLGDVLADLLLDAYDRWRAQNPEIGWFPEECDPDSFEEDDLGESDTELSGAAD
ncbi:MAG: hypothetical protein ACI8RZ_002193 [Myxococcota bacterium]|jgi:hypothetical protein